MNCTPGTFYVDFTTLLFNSACVFFLNVALTALAALVPAADCIYRAELSSLSAAPCLLSPLSPAVWPALSDGDSRPDLSASPSLSVSGEIGRREKRITFMMTIKRHTSVQDLNLFLKALFVSLSMDITDLLWGHALPAVG